MSDLSSPPAHQPTPLVPLSPTQTQDLPPGTNLVLIDPSAEIVSFEYETLVRSEFERGLHQDEAELDRASFLLISARLG